MRRILLVLTVLVAVVAIFALGPAWQGRAAPRRAAPVAPDVTASVPVEGTAPESATPEAAEADASTRGAVVRGVVTGPMGVLWCARVVAYRGETVIAETWTDPKGLYSIALKPRVEFDFAVEPAPETGLLARRVALSLGPGEERVEDVRLEEGAALRGKLVDPEGRGYEGLELFALKPEDFERVAGTFDRAVIAGVAVAQVRCSRDGSYWLRGIEEGVYSLVVCASDWMFPGPVSARTDGPDLSLVILPALTIDLEVKDVETGQPVDLFSVTARQGVRVILEDSGTAGVFSRRIPFPGQRDPRSLVLLEVAATGYLPPGLPVNSGSQKKQLWLVPRRDPNTTIRLSFDNREPYRGELFVHFYMLEGWGGNGHAKFERVREGVYRGALPYGRWELDVLPVSLFAEQRFPAQAELRAGREAEVARVLPAGGTLLLSEPAVAKRSPSVSIRTAAEAEKDSRGRYFLIPREGLRIEGIPPGSYQLGHMPRGVVQDVVWFRDVRVEVGSTEQITLPAD